MTSPATTYPWLERVRCPTGWTKYLLRRRQGDRSIAIEDAIDQMQREYGEYGKDWRFGGGLDPRFYVFWVRP